MGQAARRPSDQPGGQVAVWPFKTVKMPKRASKHARVGFPGQELPVGVVTAAVGAPALVALLVGRAMRRR